MENMSALNRSITCFGECFLYVSQDKSTPSGFPLSMAFHLKMLGANPVLISRVGLDDFGKRIIRFLEEKGISSDCFQVDYDLPTGTQNNLTDHRITKAWNNLNADDSCLKKINQSSLLIHSTHPLAFQPSREALQLLIQEKNERLVYVAPGCTNLLKESVQRCLQNAYILYLDIRELNLLTGWFSQYASVADRIAVLQNHFSISCVVVVNESHGYSITAQGRTHFLPAKMLQSEFNSSTALLAGFFSIYKPNTTVETAIEFGARLNRFVYASGDEYTPYAPCEIQDQTQ